MGTRVYRSAGPEQTQLYGGQQCPARSMQWLNPVMNVVNMLDLTVSQ